MKPNHEAILHMIELKENIIKIVGEDPKHLEEVLLEFSSIKLKRNEYLLTEGNVCRNIYYVKKGLLEVFKIDKNGIEKTVDILLSDSWFTDLHSYLSNMPSTLNVRIYKATELYKLSQSSYNTLMQKVPKFAEAYMRIIEMKYQESIERSSALSTMSAIDKIEWLRQFKPAFFTCVSDRLIASYLGISKETFCRQKYRKVLS